MQPQIEEPIYKKLNEIENEIQGLKLLILQQREQKQIVSLRGILKGVKITGQEIEEAKRSLFKVSA